MDVRFRPLKPSTLARHLAPGQPPSESDQNFLEVIESVTGSENNPERNPNPGGQKERPTRPYPWAGEGAPANENADPPPDDDRVIGADRKTNSPTDRRAAEEKPLGKRIDMTA